MYFVCSAGGELRYFRNADSRNRPNLSQRMQKMALAEFSVMTRGHWACEATLWTQWVHRGSLAATKDSVLLALDAGKFTKIAAASGRTCTFIYCEAFVRLLNDMDSDELSDLCVPSMDLNAVARESCPVPRPRRYRDVWMGSRGQ